MLSRLLPLAMLAACGAPSDPPTATIDTLPGGTLRVVNHAPAGWADTSGWKIVLEAEHTYPLDSAGSLDAPNYPHMLSNGEIFVLNQMPPFIQRYAADFTPIGRFGREGAGPGEFRNPGARGFGDSIAVLDNGRSTLILFAGDGEYLHEAIIPTFTDWMGARDDRGLLPLIGRYAPASGVGVMWWSFDEHRVIDSIIGPPAPQRRMWESCRFVIPHQADLELTPTRSGLAWWGTTDVDRFVLTQHGRDTVRVVENPGRPRFPVDSGRIEEYFNPEGFVWKQCGAEMQRSDIPSERPAWMWLTVDAEDNLWVARPSPSGHSYDVYNPEGLWLGEVPSPITGGENDYWSGDNILTVSQGDEIGYTLRRYRIVR